MFLFILNFFHFFQKFFDVAKTLRLPEALISNLELLLVQARRHGGAFRGRAPQMTACAPQTKIVPSKRGLFPEEINRLGATGVQIETQIGVCGIFVFFVD